MTTSPLHTLIADEIAQRGPIPFVDFMTRCLYHPQHGYYMHPRIRIGKEGDFFTSSSVHALFGGLLARQLVEMDTLLGAGAFTLVEQGAGEGHLMRDVLDAVRRDAPAFYDRLQVRLVEVSPDNRRRQALQLTEHSDRIDWCSFEELPLFTGCFLSNELVDAFPVHMVEMRDGVLSEVYVTATDKGFGELFLPPSTLALAAHFDWLGVAPCEGNRAEINLAAVQWMRAVATKLQRGFALTIDYGYPAVELYAPHRRNGTLMCYHRHSAGEDPYVRVGEQDLTAHVDFTALAQAGAEVGLDPICLTEQYRFLMALGFVEELIRLEAQTVDPIQAQGLRMTLKHLIMPDEGMGTTFKVLVQGKGVGCPALLCQRRMADLPLPI
jgi:SAM-dependent MidA family methyltransferase